MTNDNLMTLYLLGELISARRANDPEKFKSWLSIERRDLGEPVVEELLLDWIDSVLTEKESDRLTAWYLLTRDIGYHLRSLGSRTQ